MLTGMAHNREIIKLQQNKIVLRLMLTGMAHNRAIIKLQQKSAS